MLYSAQTGGFYAPEIHGEAVPADAVPVSQEQYVALLDGQAAGNRIVADADGYPILVAPLPMTPDQVWERIKAERDRRSEAGCLIAGYWFHNDLKSRTQWERMANRSVALADVDPYLVDGAQVAWKTMAGAFVPLTAGLIRQVVDAFEIQEVATFKAAEIHRATMAAAADPAAYDFSAGWPAIFAG